MQTWADGGSGILTGRKRVGEHESIDSRDGFHMLLITPKYQSGCLIGMPAPIRVA
jgi:hypothetical protein